MNPAFLRTALKAREESDSLRELRNSRGLIDFCSNDYLGVARDPNILARFAHMVGKLEAMNGSTGSRLLTGNSQLVEDSEKNTASFFGAKAALYYSSGYTANLGLLSAVAKRGDTIILDELCHASLIDGARLSFAESFKFKHNDTEDLIKKIGNASGNVFVVVEGVYSMDGDKGRLKEINEVCKKHEAFLIVDEAHSGGMYGSSGQGLCFEEKIHKDVFARVITFGKAFGFHGAVVLGSKELKSFLLNFSRAQIYSTAVPVHHVQLIDEILYWFDTNFKFLEFREKVDSFKSLLQEEGVDVVSDESHIFSVLVPGNSAVKAVANGLLKRGFNVLPVMSPTVKEGTERLRIILHDHNTESQCEELVKLLKELL